MESPAPATQIVSMEPATPVVDHMDVMRRNSGGNGKKEETPKTAQETRMQEQRKNPRKDAIEAQEKWPPSIESSTRATMARAMAREYQALVKVIDDAGPTAVEPWQLAYRDIMEQIYRERMMSANISSASPEDIAKSFAAAMAGENGSQYEVMALKIMESQQEALQVATGAYARVAERSHFDWHITPRRENAEEREHVALLRSTGGDGQSEYAGDRHVGQREFLRRLASPIATLWHDDLIKQNRALAAEGRKRWRIIQGTTFPSNATYDPDRRFSGHELSEVQKAYLDSLETLSQVQPGDRIPAGAQQQVDKELQSIIDARMNAYAHHDVQPRGELLNVVEVRLGMWDRLAGVDAAQVSNRRIVLNRHGFEGNVVMIAGREADRNAFMDEIVTQIKDNTDERVGKMLKEVLNREALNDQITVLERQVQPRALTQEEQDKITELDKQQQALTADIGVVDQYEKALGDKEEQEKGLKELRATIPATEMARIDQYNNPDPYDPANEGIRYWSDQKARKQIEIDKLTSRVTALREHSKNLGEKLSKTPAAMQAAVQAEMAANKTDISNAEGDLATAKTEQLDIQNKIDVRQAFVDKYKAIVDEINAKQRALEQTTKNADKIKAQLKAKSYSTSKKPEELKKEIQAKIEDRKTQRSIIEAATRPDRFKQRQLEALRTYRDQIATATANDNIQNRVNQRYDSLQVATRLEAAAAIYPGYNTTYLRTMQILFGDRSTQDTTEGRKLFESGTRLLRPEDFEKVVDDYIDERGLPRGMAFGPEHVNGDFVNFLLDDMRTKVRSRELGLLPPAHEQRMRQVEAVKAVDIAEERMELQKEENTKMDAYVEQTNTRKVSIQEAIETNVAGGQTFADIAHDLNDVHFDGEPVLSDTEVEEMYQQVRTVFRDEVVRLVADPPRAAIIAEVGTTKTLADIMADAAYNPPAISAKIRKTIESAHKAAQAKILEVNTMYTDRKKVQEMAEIVTVNRRNESIELFEIAVEQMIPPGAMQDDVLQALADGAPIEWILKQTQFASVFDQLQKANHFAQSGVTLLGGVMYAATPAEIRTLENGLKQGLTLDEAIEALSPPGQTELRLLVQEIAIMTGAASLDDIKKNDAITKATLDRSGDRKPLLNAPGAPDETLRRMVDAAQATEDRLRLDQIIKMYAEIFTNDEGLEDLTARIVYDRQLQNDIAYAKMLAEQVIQYRNANRPTSSAFAGGGAGGSTDITNLSATGSA